MNRIISLTARRFVAPAVAASALVGTSNASPTRMEEAAKKDDSDPYSNLPEEDERTLCTICLVNRQGPCRPYWRKFERCLKDQKPADDTEDDDDKKDLPDAEHRSTECDRYMMPWLTCIQSYRNMYTLYFNYMNQLELIEPVEKEVREDELFEWNNVDVEWTPYVEWVKSKGYTLWDLYWRLKQTASPVAIRPKFEGEDPEMIEIEVNNIKLEENGLPIQLAYAKDQGGLLLGMEYFTDEKKENAETGTLKFSFRPGMTSTVQFYALYKKDEGEEARFLCSNPQSLVLVAFETGDVPEGEF